MPFVLRPYRRFHVDLPVTYEAGFQGGRGTVWNMSWKGWRLSGDLPLQRGDVCSLRVKLPTNKQLSISAGIVRWVRGQDFGLETLVLDGNAQAQLGKYLHERMEEL
ncbi:PilZ domain-containing protein [Nitrospira sp. CMX1]